MYFNLLPLGRALTPTPTALVVGAAIGTSIYISRPNLLHDVDLRIYETVFSNVYGSFQVMQRLDRFIRHMVNGIVPDFIDSWGHSLFYLGRVDSRHSFVALFLWCAMTQG